MFPSPLWNRNISYNDLDAHILQKTSSVILQWNYIHLGGTTPFSLVYSIMKKHVRSFMKHPALLEESAAKLQREAV